MLGQVFIGACLHSSKGFTSWNVGSCKSMEILKKLKEEHQCSLKKQEPSEMFLFDPDRGNESKMERLIREMSEDFICSKLAPWKICTRFIMRKGKFFCSDVRGLLGWDTVKSAGFLDLRPCKPVL